MSGAEQHSEQGKEQHGLNPADLDLLQSLDDESKDESELWAEADAKDAAAVDAAAEGAGDESDGAPSDDDQDAAAVDAAAADDAGAKAGGSGKGGRSGQGRQEARDGQFSGTKQDGHDTDIWANATQEQRAEIERLMQADRSSRGRISALQKKLSQQQRAPATGARDTGQQQGSSATPGSYLKSEAWGKLKEEYPEIAEGLEPVIGGLEGRVSVQEQHLTETELWDQQQQLTAQHSDWLEVTAGREWGEWLETVPQYVRDVVDRNTNAIVDADEAADVISRFKAFRSSQSSQATGQEGSNGAGDNDLQGRDDQQTGNDDDLSKRRQRQRASASSARSTGPGAATGIPDGDDEEAIWRALDAQERREVAHASG